MADNMEVTPVPEPGTFALFGAGGVLVLALIRQRRARS